MMLHALLLAAMLGDGLPQELIPVALPQNTIDEFYATRDGNDVVITGPWHNGRHVWYATLSTPTEQQIKTALATARATWAAERVVSPKAFPKSPSNADVDKSLPVGSVEALDEVNAKRIARGLRPLIRDDGLTIGAAKCAVYIASIRSSNHTANDFAFLPSGAVARAGGLGVADPSWGWLSCCYLENWTYGGAAYVVRPDGQRTMYLFVR